MKNILLVSHYTETMGVMDKLASYFSRHNYSLFFILNPLNPKSLLSNKIKFGSKEIKYKLPWMIQYLLEGGLAVYKFKTNFKIKTEFDLAICFDPLSFINTYIFRKFYKIKKIVYYNVDFSIRRFNNRAINYIYLLINIFAYRKCDYFFYLTENFIKKIDLFGKYSDKSFLLRHSVNIKKNVNNIRKIPNSIIYAGSLSNTNAADFTDLIKALELIKRNDIDFVFDLYGEGEQKSYIKEIVNKSMVRKNINFKGVVANNILIEKILPKYKIGVCLYITEKKNSIADYMFNGTDLTTKIVEYIACGLPVVSIRLYDAFNIIKKNEFGFLVKDRIEWDIALTKLLTDIHLYNFYSKNAFNYARNYDEKKILNPVLDKILQDM